MASTPAPSQANKGLMPASVVHARQLLASQLTRRVEEIVGEVMLADLAHGEVHELVEAVLTADIDLEQAVKLLGVTQPYEGEVRAATFDGVIAGGRWGSVRNPHGASDISGAMGHLGGLLELLLAHVRAGGGKAGELPAFGLALLARK
eukprot:5547263-Pleurochrysis_carterae.AAC.1